MVHPADSLRKDSAVRLDRRSVTSLETVAVVVALAQLGKPYVFGAAGPNAFDCSGLIEAAYRAAGISLPRDTYHQVAAGQAVPDIATIAPGDDVHHAQPEHR